MPLDIRPLKPSLVKVAQEELNENPNRIESDLQHLREWIDKQPHLKARKTDQFLIAFLRGNKHSLERAKSKLDKYFTIKTALSELFGDCNLDNPKILEVLQLGVGLRLLQTVSDNGPSVSIIRPGAYDPQKFSFLDILKPGSMIVDISLLEDDNAIVAGHIQIIDLANVTAAHLFQLEPTIMKKLTTFGQDAIPIRQKGFHYINVPSGFDRVFNMFKGFLNEKNKKRLFVHGKDLSTLYEHVPKSILPTEYGGNAGSIQDNINYWEKKLLEYRNYFIEDKQYGTIENLRIGPSVNYENLFGLDGSFRKLDVD